MSTEIPALFRPQPPKRCRVHGRRSFFTLREAIKAFRDRTAVSIKVKWITVPFLWITTGVSAVFFVESTVIRVILFVFVAAATWYILSRPVFRKGEA